MTGGRSWTPDWLSFNNSYFKRGERENEDNDVLLWAETDQSLMDDDEFTSIFCLDFHLLARSTSRCLHNCGNTRNQIFKKIIFLE